MRHCHLLVAILLLTSLPTHRAEAAPARPNIVFILIDDFGYADCGPYGAKDIHTPHIDRLAREGVKFTDFYANAPVCTPTRCGLITGCWQQRGASNGRWVLRDRSGGRDRVGGGPIFTRRIAHERADAARSGRWAMRRALRQAYLVTRTIQSHAARSTILRRAAGALRLLHARYTILYASMTAWRREGRGLADLFNERR
jgi:hypothetical protein